MVYVNSKKFACESCIKGHRSSSCHHTDRPLFEIKKKGRPVSQCPKCRELRQSKKVHSKCTCDDGGEKAKQEQMVPLCASSKARRYIPIVPSLPNGLKDVLQSANPAAGPPDERQKVDSLLNPCKCKDVRNCNCLAGASEFTIASSSTPNPLDALAQAATIRQAEERSMGIKAPVVAQPSSRKAKIPRPRPGSPSQHASRKRSKPSAPRPSASLGPTMRVIAPPPGPLLTSFPDFGTYASAPMSTCTGTGCTCGTQCACPGCVEHRGSTHALADHRDCGEGCGTCVDKNTTELRLIGGTWETAAPSVSLPGPSQGATSSSTASSATPPVSFLDQFFARAAALPPPPTHRRAHLDPTDTTTAVETAPVNLPKLECCGGACLCPAGNCSCRSSCGGSCLDDHLQQQQDLRQRPEPAASPPLRSCCAGKRAVV
ncbi:ACE1 transcription factor [Coprinopsis sp. MPI-PUGE-AT-0042]|nr:ACE1 transcription factor [Coprinopsis sp. MPI-PUGE-AT-0042]